MLDQLCIHKHAISQWSTNPNAQCCCQRWSQYKKAAINPSDAHWVLAGSLLTGLLPDDLSVIAEGSLLNKVFPSKKEYHSTLKFGLHQWTKRNGLPSMPSSIISDLAQSCGSNTSKRSPATSRSRPLQTSNAYSKRQSSTVKTNKLPPCGSSVHASTSSDRSYLHGCFNF